MPLVSRLFCAAADLIGAVRDHGQTTPPEVVRFDDIPYGADPKWQLLDVYRPRGWEGQRLPVIVSVHGGAWVHGDKDWYQYYCLDFARRGFAVVNFTYHLLPAAPVEQVLEDACLAFRWTVDHAEEYGFDLHRLFAMGDSAGAQILGLVLGLWTDPTYRARYPFAPPPEVFPKAAALCCGIYEMKRGALDTLLSWELLPEHGSPREVEQYSVLARVNPDFPPLFLATSDRDFLQLQTPLLAEALRRAKVPFRYRYYTGGLFHDFQLAVQRPAAQRCRAELCGFFREVGEKAVRPTSAGSH